MTEAPSPSQRADHEYIWLQPECCAGPYEGRMWCQDNVFDDGECEDGNNATKYVRADKVDEAIAQARADALEEAARAVEDIMSRMRTTTVASASYEARKAIRALKHRCGHTGGKDNEEATGFPFGGQSL